MVSVPSEKLYNPGVSDISILPTPAEIRAADRKIAPHIRRTALRRSDSLSDFLGGDVWLKLECEQLTGSFKIRGATNVLGSFDEFARARGVVTASAGNHGLGIAAAAMKFGVTATVFAPHTAPAVKIAGIRALGASVDTSAATYDAAEALARADAQRTGATFVSPCCGRLLLAGQGTVALEVLEELILLRTVIVCVGGGGLVAGMAGMMHVEAPHARMIGAQSERTNAMALALASGLPTTIPDAPTLADGLAGQADAEMLAQGQAALQSIAVVREQDIASAIAFLWIEEGLRVEGAGAVGVAAALAGLVPKLEFPAVIVVSGRNIDEARHRDILEGRYEST